MDPVLAAGAANLVGNVLGGLASKLIDLVIERNQAKKDLKIFIDCTLVTLERNFIKHHIVIYDIAKKESLKPMTLNLPLGYACEKVSTKGIDIRIFVDGSIQYPEKQISFAHTSATQPTKPSALTRAKNFVLGQKFSPRIVFVKRKPTWEYTPEEKRLIEQQIGRLKIQLMAEHGAQEINL